MAEKNTARFRKGANSKGTKKALLQWMEGKNHDRKPPYTRKRRSTQNESK